MKARRLGELTRSADPVVQEIVQLRVFWDYLQKWSRPVQFRGTMAATATMRRAAFSHRLCESVDGKGLRHAGLVPCGCAHDWVTSGSAPQKGAKYNASLGLRLATLPTRLRASRGRPDAPKACDCCGTGVLESLGHELQHCPRTKGARIRRHDRVGEYLCPIGREKPFQWWQ